MLRSGVTAAVGRRHFRLRSAAPPLRRPRSAAPSLRRPRSAAPPPPSPLNRAQSPTLLAAATTPSFPRPPLAAKISGVLFWTVHPFILLTQGVKGAFIDGALLLHFLSCFYLHSQ